MDAYQTHFYYRVRTPPSNGDLNNSSSNGKKIQIFKLECFLILMSHDAD